MTSSRLEFSASWIAKALGIALPPEEEQSIFGSIVSDSRKVEPGCLFVALKGELFDGHDFIAQAIEKGAKGIILRKEAASRFRSRAGDTIFFPVTDTLSAYRVLGKEWRAKFQIPIAMIAGSNGKTTTKELLSALLLGKFERVLKTQGSQNGFVGIPMTLLELDSSHQAAVIEVGIDEPGAMVSHVSVVSPTVSVLTVVQPEHLEKLIDLETVAREEGYALSETLARNGAIAINCDDPLIVQQIGEQVSTHFKNSLSGKKLGYTLGNLKNKIQANLDERGMLQGVLSDGFQTLEVQGGAFKKPERFSLPLPGRHNATNLLAAIAVASLMGLTAEEMRRGLQKFAAPEGRSQVRKTSDKTQVICDYYNSQPASLKAGLELLAEMKPASEKASRWACLADMLELGSEEERYHRDPADWISSLGIEHVLLYGHRMKWLEDELRKRRFRGTLKHFESQSDLARELAEKAAPGSVILIKGSNSMKMGEVWKAFEHQRK